MANYDFQGSYTYYDEDAFHQLSATHEPGICTNDTVRGYSRVRFLVSLKGKEEDNQIHKLEVEQVIYFSKYNVVSADVDNEF